MGKIVDNFLVFRDYFLDFILIGFLGKKLSFFHILSETIAGKNDRSPVKIAALKRIS